MWTHSSRPKVRDTTEIAVFHSRELQWTSTDGMVFATSLAVNAVLDIGQYPRCTASGWSRQAVSRIGGLGSRRNKDAAKGGIFCLCKLTE